MKYDFVPNIYFSDYFGVHPQALEDYGAFNVSLINDLPLFIDPFLLFNSRKEEYQRLHSEIIQYLRFLRDKSLQGRVNSGLLQAWYVFREVHQNWFGFSRVGNRGSGLGMHFARTLNENLNTIFSNFGREQITQGSHLEKLTLIGEGVGRDNISDFTTNLIKEYLLEYTQRFAQEFISPELLAIFGVARVRFDYQRERWASAEYELPSYEGHGDACIKGTRIPVAAIVGGPANGMSHLEMNENYPQLMETDIDSALAHAAGALLLAPHPNWTIGQARHMAAIRHQVHNLDAPPVDLGTLDRELRPYEFVAGCGMARRKLEKSRFS